MVLVWQRPQSLSQESDFVGANRQFTHPGLDHIPRNPPEVPNIRVLKQLVGFFAHHVLAHVKLNPAAPVQKVRKAGLTAPPLGNHAPRDGYDVALF